MNWWFLVNFSGVLLLSGGDYVFWSMSWEVVIKSQTEIHVIPDEDAHEHSMENGWDVKRLYFSQCSCGARCEFANSNWITIHSSFDGREGVEWANALLSEK